MASLNICQFIGNIGKIDTRYTQSGSAVTSFSLAVNESWKDKTSGEKQERTEWVQCSTFGKLAEIAQKYATVGTLIYIEGRLRTEKWQDKSGVDRYTTKILVDSLQLLGGKREEANESPDSLRQSTSGGARGTNDFDDDIPFAPVRSFP